MSMSKTKNIARTSKTDLRGVMEKLKNSFEFARYDSYPFIAIQMSIAIAASQPIGVKRKANSRTGKNSPDGIANANPRQIKAIEIILATLFVIRSGFGRTDV
jgi:hypothetical protein